MRRISVAERATEISVLPGQAAAAVASVHHPTHGDSLVVLVDPATGALSLPSGPVEAGEKPQDVAIRELCVQSGTPALQFRVKPGAPLGEWVTDAGVSTLGFAVRLSELFPQMAGPQVAHLPWRAVAGAEMTSEFHVVAPAEHGLGPDPVEFETPTLRVLDPAAGVERVLSGLAVEMVSRWRHRVMPGG